MKDLLKRLRFNESTISTLLGIAVIVISGVLLFNYFSNRPTVEVSDLDLGPTVTQQPVKPGEITEGETPHRLPLTHTVIGGDHLWAIAEFYYGSGYNWVDIAENNHLKNADLLEKGMELTIPNVPARMQTIVTRKTTAESTINDQTKNVISGNKYTIASGDSLWSISVRAYSDGYQWPKIYQANQKIIGTNPNRIEKEIELIIPRE